jgi:hypothetical protein
LLVEKIIFFNENKETNKERPVFFTLSILVMISLDDKNLGMWSDNPARPTDTPDKSIPVSAAISILLTPACHILFRFFLNRICHGPFQRREPSRNRVKELLPKN